MNSDALKKMVYVTLGYAATHPDEVRKLTSKLAEQGKISEAEGHAFLEEMNAKFKTIQADVESNFKNVSNDIVDQLHQAYSEKLVEFKSRIADLEKSGMAKMDIIMETIKGDESNLKSNAETADTKVRSTSSEGTLQKSPEKNRLRIRNNLS